MGSSNQFYLGKQRKAFHVVKEFLKQIGKEYCLQREVFVKSMGIKKHGFRVALHGHNVMYIAYGCLYDMGSGTNYMLR